MLDAISEFFRTRMKTQVYAIFGFWWVALNWQFFNAWLFVDEKLIFQKYGLLKSEYLRHYFHNYFDWTYLWHLGLKFIVAVFMTYLMVAVLPRRVLLPAFRALQAHEFDKQVVRLKQQREIAREEAALQRRRTDRLLAEEEKVKTEKKVKKTDESILWEDEYTQLRLTSTFDQLDDLVECIYQHGGYIRDNGFAIDQDILVYAHTNGLIEYDPQEQSRLQLTTKGKYFIKRYKQDNAVSVAK